MSTANQIAREALEAAMQHVISYGGPSVEVTQKIDAALAALSEQSGDGERSAEWWLRNNIAPAVRMQMGDDYADELLKYADRLSDCDRLRERVKELEGEVSYVKRCLSNIGNPIFSYNPLARLCRRIGVDMSDEMLMAIEAAARTALPPAAPQ